MVRIDRIIPTLDYDPYKEGKNLKYESRRVKSQTERPGPLKVLKQPKFYLMLSLLLLAIWFASAFLILLFPASFTLLWAAPARFVLRIISGISRYSAFGEGLVRRLKKILPLRKALRAFNIGFNDSEIDDIEMAVALYLIIEGICFYVYQEHRACLRENQGGRSKTDQTTMETLANLIIDDSEPSNLIQFIAYSWYCDYSPYKNETNESTVPIDWSSLDEASQRHNLEIPRLTSSMLHTFLSCNLGLESEAVCADLVAKVEAKLGCKFPVIPQDASSGTNSTETDNDSCASGGSTSLMIDPKVLDSCFIYGYTEMCPLYRPIIINFIIWFAHSMVTLFLFPLLGYEKWNTVRVDLEGLMNFYVLPAQVDNLNESGEYSPRSPRADHKKALVILHGFGFGIIPYVPLLLFYAIKRPNRTVIVPEFKWFGLYPLGGIKFSELPLTVGMSFTRACKWIGRAIFPKVERAEKSRSERLFSYSPAPHQCTYNQHKYIITIPGMPEIVDEIVSFTYYMYKYGGYSVEDTSFLGKILAWPKSPKLPYNEYKLNSYRKFWMDDGKINESEPDEVIPSHFLRSLDPAEAQHSRDEFFRRMRCRGKQSQINNVLSWVKNKLRNETVLDGTRYKQISTTNTKKSSKEGFYFDILAHSYGSAVTSCMVKTYSNAIDRIALADPICWVVQLTKKSQLVRKNPFTVKLMDRSYQQPYPTGSLHIHERIFHALDYCFDRTLLLIYWYFVYRDFGTVWTTCRQLNGCEYIDVGEMLKRTQEGKCLVVLGFRDLICPGKAIYDFLKSKALDNENSKNMDEYLCTSGDHHGGFLLRPAAMNRIYSFLNA